MQIHKIMPNSTIKPMSHLCWQSDYSMSSRQTGRQYHGLWMSVPGTNKLTDILLQKLIDKL